MSIFYYFPTYVLAARTRALYALCDGMFCSKAYRQMPNDGASLPDDRALVFTILRLPACSVAPTVDMLCSKAYCDLRDNGALLPDDGALVSTLRRFLA